jgi:hypothetical protein
MRYKKARNAKIIVSKAEKFNTNGNKLIARDKIGPSI